MALQKMIEVIFRETSKGTIGFVMVNTVYPRYFVGIAEGMNTQIDINHILNGGVEIPYAAGLAIFEEENGKS